MGWLTRKPTVSVDEFAEVLAALHWKMYDRQSLATFTKADQSVSTEYVHWFVFGAWAHYLGIGQACGKNVSARNAICESFIGQVYKGLNTRGMPPEEVTAFAVDLKAEFDEYNAAWRNESGEGRFWHVGQVVCRRVLGRIEPSACKDFSVGALNYLIGTVESIGTMYKASNVKM